MSLIASLPLPRKCFTPLTLPNVLKHKALNELVKQFAECPVDLLNKIIEILEILKLFNDENISNNNILNYLTQNSRSEVIIDKRDCMIVDKKDNEHCINMNKIVIDETDVDAINEGSSNKSNIHKTVKKNNDKNKINNDKNKNRIITNLSSRTNKMRKTISNKPRNNG